MLNVKPFRQRTNYCGPASLKMVLEYYGIKKTEHQLVRLTKAHKTKGIEAEGMLRAARKLKLTGFIKDFSTLKDLNREVIKNKRPVIVGWFSEDDGHYSIVVDIDKENIHMQDPDLGQVRAMRLDLFYRLWFDFPGDYIVSRNKITVRRMLVLYKKNK